MGGGKNVKDPHSSCWAAWWVGPEDIAPGCSQVKLNDVIGEDEAGCSDCPEASLPPPVNSGKGWALMKLFSNYFILKSQFCLR